MLARMIRNREGNALIELAIALPFLALLLVGFIEAGRYLALGVRLSNAAHAGVQYGAQGLTASADSAGIASAACGDSGFACTTATPKPGSSPSPDTMYVSSRSYCASATSPCPAGYRYVQVDTSGTFEPLLNYPMFGKAVPMSAQATQQVAQ